MKDCQLIITRFRGGKGKNSKGTICNLWCWESFTRLIKFEVC